MAIKLLSLVGPSVMAAAVAYVYHTRQVAPSFALSTPMCVTMLFVVYASGVIPRCPFFPDWFFKSNVFSLLYRLYCTQLVGYRLLKPVMHAHSRYPHSDFRTGIRLLSGSRGKFRFLHVAAATPATPAAAAPLSAAAALAAASAPPSNNAGVNGSRGSDYVDLGAVTSQTVKTGTLVIPVPMFADNYAYLIVSLDTCRVIAVDPADPIAVLQLLRSVERTVGAPLQLTEVLTTHKHWDHAGGNQELLDLARHHAANATNATGSPDTHADGNEALALAYLVSPDLAIIGSEVDQPMACTRLVQPMDLLYVAEKRIAVRVLQAPGHTRGSVMYVVGDVPPLADAAEAPSTSSVPVCTALFTGDALFSGGFGAPFETATLEDIVQTRQSFLFEAAITTQPHTGETVEDDNVLIYCGHEYTERILGEVEDITRKLVKETPSIAPLKTYLRDVRLENKRVRVLRVSSDGLEDVANEARTHHDAGRPTYRLPASSMPTTLAVEKRINPLLTLDESAFKEPSVMPLWSAETFDQTALERLLYCSPRRTVCMVKPPVVTTAQPTASPSEAAE